MSDYDYTASNNGVDADEYAIGAFTPPAKSADEIAKENGFRDIPPGEHILVVSSVVINPAQCFNVVMPNNQVANYLANTATVRLSMPNDPRASITDGFTLPPDNPDHHEAYNQGGTPAKPGIDPKTSKPYKVGQAGMAANKFVHFMDRLGFVDAEGNLTAAGKKPSNWKGRAIKAKVKAGFGTYKDKEGVEKPSRANIQMFSYERADAAAMNAVSGPSGSSTGSGNRQAVSVGAGAGAGSGSGQSSAIGFDDV